MADEKKTTAAPEHIYEVVGLTPLKDNTMPIKIKGEDIDLAQASQVQLKALYESGEKFVRIAPAK